MKYLALICFAILLSHNGTKGTRASTEAANEKIRQLDKMTMKNPIISLDNSMFQTYVNTPLRDYSLVVLFVDSKQYCDVCQILFEEYQMVANSFRYSASYNHKLIFGIVQRDIGLDVFKMLGLYRAPIMMYFPANDHIIEMNFEKFGVLAEDMAKWIGRHADVEIKVSRPHDYTSIKLFAALAVVIATFLYKRRNNLRFLFNPQMWATEAVLFCGFMVSGQVWNGIRGAPLYYATKKGPIYICVGHQGQFWAESIIVGILNGGVVIGMIMIIEAAGGVTGPEVVNTKLYGKLKRGLSVVGLIFVCVFFSLLLSVFKYKIQDYPFSFLFN